MSAEYYVRIAGKVYGPFSSTKLKRLADGGKLLPTHELSPDRVTWIPAGQARGLFAPSASGSARAVMVRPPHTVVLASPTALLAIRTRHRPRRSLGVLALAVAAVAAATWTIILQWPGISEGEALLPQEPLPPAWIDAATPLEQGDVRVRVASVVIDRVPLVGLPAEAQSDEARLMIRLTVENRSETRKIDFRGFDPQIAVAGLAELSDNFDNAYRPVGFGAARAKGQRKIESIYPGKVLDDVLVFEVPVDAAEFLRLELPARNVGHAGTLRFQIPCAAIRRAQPESASARVAQPGV